MEEMTAVELAVKYAVECELRKLLAIAKDAKDVDEIIKRIEAKLDEKG